jgi:methionyl-tRNA synthetase
MAGASEKIGFGDFQRMKMVVAEIVEARDHPDADKLLCMEIDLGGERRQIVAGLKGHYEAGGLSGRKIVVVENLEPATLRGERSEGMLLAATTDDGRVVLLAPDADVPAGSKIS